MWRYMHMLKTFFLTFLFSFFLFPFFCFSISWRSRNTKSLWFSVPPFVVFIYMFSYHMHREGCWKQTWKWIVWKCTNMSRPLYFDASSGNGEITMRKGYHRMQSNNNNSNNTIDNKVILVKQFLYHTWLYVWHFPRICSIHFQNIFLIPTYHFHYLQMFLHNFKTPFPWPYYDLPPTSVITITLFPLPVEVAGELVTDAPLVVVPSGRRQVLGLPSDGRGWAVAVVVVSPRSRHKGEYYKCYLLGE